MKAEKYDSAKAEEDLRVIINYAISRDKEDTKKKSKKRKRADSKETTNKKKRKRDIADEVLKAIRGIERINEEKVENLQVELIKAVAPGYIRTYTCVQAKKRKRDIADEALEAFQEKIEKIENLQVELIKARVMQDAFEDEEWNKDLFEKIKNNISVI